MAFIMSPAVQIEHGPGGRIVGLNHLGQPYGPLTGVLNAQKLAEAYLHEVVTIYGIDPALLNALTQSPSEVIENAGAELRFARQDAITGTATVSFQQTYFGLPIWQAGFTVSMLTAPLRATSSLNTLHTDIKIEKPKDDAKCMPRRITPPELAKLLNVTSDDREIVINGEKLWVYRYDAAQRLPEGGPGSGSGKGGGVADLASSASSSRYRRWTALRRHRSPVRSAAAAALSPPALACLCRGQYLLGALSAGVNRLCDRQRLHHRSDNDDRRQHNHGLLGGDGARSVAHRCDVAGLDGG